MLSQLVFFGSFFKNLPNQWEDLRKPWSVHSSLICATRSQPHWAAKADTDLLSHWWKGSSGRINRIKVRSNGWSILSSSLCRFATGWKRIFSEGTLGNRWCCFSSCSSSSPLWGRCERSKGRNSVWLYYIRHSGSKVREVMPILKRSPCLTQLGCFFWFLPSSSLFHSCL